MKRVVSILMLIALVPMMFGCNMLNSGLSVDEDSDVIRISLDGFEGYRVIRIDHDNPGEGTLFFSVEISEGSLKASYRDYGILLGTTLPYFTVNESDGKKTGGTYVDSSVAVARIILEANEPVSGEILLSFNRMEK